MSETKGAEEAEAKVEKMFEYGYRKSNYGPDELVTDAHGNPISVVDAMLSAEKAAATETVTPHLCYYSPRIPGNTGSAIRLCAVTGHHPASGGAAGVQSSRYQAASCRA